ncbi:MAG: phosphate-starvation-inducible PsiE family protein [Nostocaceae cyanobacterium]|nr:phosphate-starvation-inducible PsiE family protein [Nostocaceae cyanobacterium]
MRKREKNRFILWGSWFNRNQVVTHMEGFQDFIVICLCLGMFCVMLLQIVQLFQSLLHPLDFQDVTADILFILILVELFRLLIVYLQEHSISVGVAVEVSIVSVLREVIVHGVLETSWIQILALCALLSVLGGLLVVCAKTPHMDHLNDTQLYHTAPRKFEHNELHNDGL